MSNLFSATSSLADDLADVAISATSSFAGGSAFDEFSANFNQFVKNNLSILNNPYVAVFLFVFLITYAGRIAPAIPSYMSNLFDNVVFKIVVFAVIAYSAEKNPAVALLSAMGFVLSMIYLNKAKAETKAVEATITKAIQERFQDQGPQMAQSPEMVPTAPMAQSPQMVSTVPQTVSSPSAVDTGIMVAQQAANQGATPAQQVAVAGQAAAQAAAAQGAEPKAQQAVAAEAAKQVAAQMGATPVEQATVAGQAAATVAAQQGAEPKAQQAVAAEVATQAVAQMGATPAQQAVVAGQAAATVAAAQGAEPKAQQAVAAQTAASVAAAQGAEPKTQQAVAQIAAAQLAAAPVDYKADIPIMPPSTAAALMDQVPVPQQAKYPQQSKELHGYTQSMQYTDAPVINNSLNGEYGPYPFLV